MNKKKTILPIIAVLLVTAITCAVAYVVITKNKGIQDRDTKIMELEARLSAIGSFVDVYTVKADVSKGQEILESDLELQTVLSTSIPASAITDASKIIGQYYRLDTKKGTTLSQELIMGNDLLGTTYERDLVFDSLPIGLSVGDYIDIRVVLPYGEGMIAIPHKRVEAIFDKTVKLVFDEAELAIYTSVLIEKSLYSQAGFKVYATKYTDPGVHTDVVAMYPVRTEIEAFITMDVNITNKAKCINSELRGIINTRLKAYNVETNQDKSLLQGGVSAEHTALEEARQIYQELVDSLGTAGGTNGGHSNIAVDRNGNQYIVDSSGNPITDIAGSVDKIENGLGDTSNITPENKVDAEGGNLYDKEEVIQ